jgi:hypothetical protein
LEGLRVVREENMLSLYDEGRIESFWKKQCGVIGNRLGKCALEDVGCMFVEGELDGRMGDGLRRLIREVPFEEKLSGLQGDGVSGYKVVGGRIDSGYKSPDRSVSRFPSFDRENNVDDSGKSWRDVNLDSEFTLKTQDQS